MGRGLHNAVPNLTIKQGYSPNQCAERQLTTQHSPLPVFHQVYTLSVNELTWSPRSAISASFRNFNGNHTRCPLI